jgi:hypothetical protein
VYVRDGPTEALGKIIATGRVFIQQWISKHHKMVPLQFLYGQSCGAPLSWDRLEDSVSVGQ